MNRLEAAVARDLAGAGDAPPVERVRRRARRQQIWRAGSSAVSLIAIVALIVIAISVTGSHSKARISTAPVATSTPTTATAAAAPLSARVELAASTMRTGSTMSGTVVVENNTGRAIQVQGCHDIFQLALENAVIKQEVAWLACLQTLTIPTGTSTYPVTVVGSYRECFDVKGQDPLGCPDSGVSPLPVGEYQVVLVESGDAVPIPPPLTLRVTP